MHARACTHAHAHRVAIACGSGRDRFQSLLHPSARADGLRVFVHRMCACELLSANAFKLSANTFRAGSVSNHNL